METYESTDIKQIERRVSQALNELAQYHNQKVIVVVHACDSQTTFYNHVNGIITAVTKENING